jgi:uncharacterized OB-fold protein
MQYTLSIQEYTAALKENRLLGLKCLDCSAITVPPRMVCRQCSGPDLNVHQLSGKGKIVTFTVVYVAPQNFVGKTPYLVIMVELDEGPWIMGNLAGVDPGNASVDLMDKKVRIIKRPPAEIPDDGPVPLFALDG